MQILYDNLIDNATLVPNTEKTGYPVANIKDYHLSKQFRFNANSGILVIDLGAAALVTDFMVGGTNLTSGATLILEANTSDSWGSPAFTTSLELYSNGFIGIQELDETYQYWRLVLSDSSLTEIILGYIFLGENLQMPGIDPSIGLAYNNDTSVTMSKTRQSYADTGVNFFSSSFSFPIITDYPYDIDGKTIATREDILEFWLLNQGAKPFIMVIYEKSKDRIPPMMGMIMQKALTFSLDRTLGYYSTKFKFEETK